MVRKIRVCVYFLQYEKGPIDEFEDEDENGTNNQENGRRKKILVQFDNQTMSTTVHSWENDDKIIITEKGEREMKKLKPKIP